MANPISPRLPLGPLPEARLTVLAIAEDPGHKVRAVSYRVALDCCGRVMRLSHDKILRRKTDVWRATAEGRELKCLKCARVGRRPNGSPVPKRPGTRRAPVGAVPDYGVSPPAWPRPASIAAGYWLWGDPR